MSLVQKYKLLLIVFAGITLNFCGKIEDPIVEEPPKNEDVPVEEVLSLRSEYEKVGDQIFDIVDVEEGNFSYEILSGNEDNYYAIDADSGIITIKIPIADSFDSIHADTLLIKGFDKNYSLIIVDGYDYFMDNLDDDYTILKEHHENYVNDQMMWTANNNLWGKGDAIPNEDFRIATLYKSTFPKGTIFIWDVPAKASTYGGASVWCYNNIFWGNRKNFQENLQGFPFQIQQIEALTLDFDFEQLYGNEQFKIAMNMFMTDVSYLTNFSENKGDFFFVFDQKETWIPNYPFELSDSMIDGKPFAWRYKKEGAYEWRRVIVKDEQKFMRGTLDIKSLFDRFIDHGYINPLQYIYHIQLGVEVTEGYGAVRVNEASLFRADKK